MFCCPDCKDLLDRLGETNYYYCPTCEITYKAAIE